MKTKVIPAPPPKGVMASIGLLAEVGLDHVGIILGIELSRLARSNKDWAQLIELCGIFRTLLADHDGLYDPTAYNDRLLLGLRGMMSEAELHILRGRMYEALLNKARRGELYMLAPIGYVKLSQGEFAIDPDEQVQAIVRLVFDTFDQQGTVRGVLRYLVQHEHQAADPTAYRSEPREPRMAPADTRCRHHDPDSSAVRRHISVWIPSARSAAQEPGEAGIRARGHGTQRIITP